MYCVAGTIQRFLLAVRYLLENLFCLVDTFSVSFKVGYSLKGV